jgi:RNA polymerase sigma-70 factor (ECF subfamily)
MASFEPLPGEDRARLWEIHRTALRAYILSAVRDLHEAEDILQDVSIVVLRHFEDFRPGSSFGAWAREIARRCLLDRAKKLKHRLLTLEPETLMALESAADRVEQDGLATRLRQSLRRCLENLGTTGKRIVELRYGKGLPLERAAELLGKSVQATYSTLKRTKQWLRRCSERRLRETPG